MAIGIILAVVLALLAIGAGALAYCMNEGSPAQVLLGVLCFAFIIAFFIVPFSFHTVQAGQVAFVKHLGEVVDTKTPGTYYDFWMTNKYVKYDSTVQNVDIETAAYSSDAQTMTVAMTLHY